MPLAVRGGPLGGRGMTPRGVAVSLLLALATPIITCPTPEIPRV